MPLCTYRRVLTVVACLVVFGSSAGQAWAQGSGMFSGRGPTSGSTGFSTGSTAPGAGFPGSSGSYAGGAMGTSAFGSSGQAGRGGTAGLGGGGQSLGTNNGGFVGRNNNNIGRVIGSNQRGGQQQGQGGRNNQFNQAQGNRNRNRNTAGRNSGGQNFNNSGGNGGGFSGGQNQNQRVIRPQQRVAFTYRQPTPQATTQVLTTRFNKLDKRKDFDGITVHAAGAVVTLRGEVNSEAARRLAAMIAGLEPGVRKVQNELVVKPGT